MYEIYPLKYPKDKKIIGEKNMSTGTAPRFSISPYFAAYDPAKPAPVVTKTVERLLSDAGITSFHETTFIH